MSDPYEKGPVDITVALGSADTGKSGVIKSLVRKAKPPRLIVWDPNGEWGDHGEVFTRPDALFSYVKGKAAPGAKPGGGKFAAVFQPGNELRTYKERFGWLCKIGFALRHLWFHVDELGGVTTASWAPDPWELITKRSGHAWLKVTACAQFPADVDKGILGNSTRLYCGRLVEDVHIDTAVRKMHGVTRADLLALPDGMFFDQDRKSTAPASRLVLFTKKGVI